ncbi:MAG: hypothetical protein RI949_832 [Pseudomonadota bacterium]|jgi:hypothetical protein
MAYYFGINNGAGLSGGVAEGSSTTSKDVEVVINTNANVPSKEELLLALEALEAYITTALKNW